MFKAYFQKFWEIFKNGFMFKSLKHLSMGLFVWCIMRFFFLIFSYSNRCKTPYRFTTSKWNKITVKMYNGQVFCVYKWVHIVNR